MSELDAGKRRSIDAADLQPVDGVVDPDTRKPLLRSKEAKGGKYTYYYLNMNGEPTEFFESATAGDPNDPDAIQSLQLEAEQTHLDALRKKG